MPNRALPTEEVSCGSHATLRTLSSRLSHSRIWFELAKFWLTTAPHYSQFESVPVIGGGTRLWADGEWYSDHRPPLRLHQQRPGLPIPSGCVHAADRVAPRLVRMFAGFEPFGRALTPT